jgi:hypothetical protein
MWRAIIAIGLGLVLAGGIWWQRHPAHPAPVDASRYETDMMEGLVRQIISDLKPPVPPVCFLAFGDGTTSPSAAFIGRFDGTQPCVRSRDSAASPPIGKYFETSTGKPGLVLHIVSFQEYIPGTFDVVVRLSNLPPSQDRFTCRIANLGGEWKIESRR